MRINKVLKELHAAKYIVGGNNVEVIVHLKNDRVYIKK